jgi:dihydrofolate reductase
MTKTVYYTATSLDGYIADPDNSLDWLFQIGAGDDTGDDDGGLGGFKAFFANVGAFAMGATTYEWIAEHQDIANWATWYGEMPCWVFTHRDPPRIPGANLTIVQGDIRPAHEAMVAAANGKDIWLVGGGELVGTFADHGLLDQIIASVTPVPLGGGAPLLPRRLLAPRLRLTDVERAGQLVHLTYAVGKP